MGPPSEAVKAPDRAHLSLVIESGKVVLSGSLPDEDTRAKILGQTVRVFGKNNVVDRLRVDSTLAKEPWMPSAPMILKAVGRDVENARMEIETNVLRISGRVKSEQAKNKVLRGLKGVSRGLEIQDGLLVGPGKAAAAPPTPAETIAHRRVPGGDVDALEGRLKGKIAHFEFNRTSITAQGAKVLDEVAAVLNGTPGSPVEIAGHTCSMGPPDYNLILGKHRAEAARKYLIAKGVRAERLMTVSYGETRPIADNATRTGRQMNRRTEFHVKKGD